MARSTFKNLLAAARAPFANRFGPLGSNVGLVDKDYDNNFAMTWSDSGDLNSLEALRVDLDGRVQLDSNAQLGAREQMVFSIVANATLGTQTFFIADRAMVITGISEIHSTLGTDAAAVILQISHETGTQAPGGGTLVQTGSFNLKGTINTIQNATLLSPKADGTPAAGLILAAGDRLSAEFTGVLTAVAGVQVTVTATPGSKEVPAVYAMNANGSIATQAFFSANRDFVITGVQMIWSTAGSDAGTVTADVFKDTSTNAPGAGTSVLAAAQSVKGAINTTVNVALSATAATLAMAAGDRLSVVMTGTLTALAGLVIVVYLAPVYNRVEVTYAMKANGSIATTGMFSCDRDYEVLEVSEVHSTAGTDGGTVSGDIFIDKGTTAPGGGATAIAAVFSLKATANTTTFTAPATALHSRTAKKGDRITFKTTGTLTALAGIVVTVSLRPV